MRAMGQVSDPPGDNPKTSPLGQVGDLPQQCPAEKPLTRPTPTARQPEREEAEANVTIISAQVVCAGAGRYGGMLWVGTQDLRRAAKALGATSWQKPKPVSQPGDYPSPFDGK